MSPWLDALVAKTHQHLVTAPDAAPARDYLLSRGVTPDVWATHRIGFSSSQVEIGECTKAFADWFPKYWFTRLVFPLTSILGKPIGVVTRGLPSDGEKRSYQQFYAYSQDVYPFLFGIDQAIEEVWRTRQVIIVEGIFDYLAVAPYLPNTVAILTASVPSSARTFFRRYTRRVWAALDMDHPGRMGCYRLAGLIPPKEHWPEGYTPGKPTQPVGYQVAIVNYAGGKDPGEMSQNGTISDLIRRMESAKLIF